jgi:predicted RNA binding protein YcfA (HicA-like mRNA interferase family)
MSKLPRITGRDAIRAFERHGFVEVRKKGSHHVLKKLGNEFLLTIPAHSGKILGKGLLKSQIDAAGLTVDQFIELLNKN